MADYIKLQELTELKDALRIKAVNEELLMHLQLSIMYMLDYSDKNGIILPNLKAMYEALERADQLITELSPTKLNNQRKQPDNEQFPISCYLPCSESR